MDFYIRKASGERELFDVQKFRNSLKKAGAHNTTIEHIIEKFKQQKPKSTQEIHEATTHFLQEQEPRIANRYNLKRALMELGPDGYPFENFVGELFAVQGFKTEVSKIVQGACVWHEVDVVAQKNTHYYMIEAKFHNRPGIKSDVKVPLYVQARFEDVQEVWKKETDGEFYIPWIITNTKFTSVAIQYAECKKIQLMGWNYPEKNNLAQLVEQYNLFPITTLTSLSKKQKRAFIREGFVMCKHAKEHEAMLKKMNLSSQEIKKIIEESQAVCNI